MSSPQKKCVFCGGTPATKGHIWPAWLDEYLPPKATHHQEIVGEILTFESKAEGPIPHTRTRQGHVGSRKPRNTCLNCNGGWMSRLEQANIPKMSSLILDRPALLRPIDQWLLAALICLITIRIEFTDPQMQGIPADDRKTLMNSGHPPFNSWRIWIARYVGMHPEDHWSRHFGMQVVSSPEHAFRPPKCNTQVSTMVIGKLCTHAISSSVMTVPEGYTGVSLTRIWPPICFDIETSSLPTLNEAEVIHLHESLAASMKHI
jgi:hypothetical protein